jgi:predicted nucleotidyltransferase
MRLRKNQQQTIRETVREIFGPDAAVYVFGSRVDDSARGGDIDLLVRLEKPQVETERKILRLVAKLQIRLGDQPIDVLLQDPEITLNPIHLEAQRTGVRL